MDEIFSVSVDVLDDVDLDIISDIEEKFKNNLLVSDDEINYFLSYLCYRVRERLSFIKSKDVINNKFTNQCDKAQSMIYYYLSELGIENVPVNTNEVIDCNVIGHSFIMAHILDNYYLIDPTYNQFFDFKKCSSSNLIIIDKVLAKSPDPGYFVKDYSLEDRKVIIDFLKSGFMKVEFNNLRLYGDSFYKTKTGVSEDYIGKEFMLESTYLKIFLNSEASLSLSKDELEEIGLLISPINLKKSVKKV